MSGTSKGREKGRLTKVRGQLQCTGQWELIKGLERKGIVYLGRAVEALFRPTQVNCKKCTGLVGWSWEDPECKTLQFVLYRKGNRMPKQVLEPVMSVQVDFQKDYSVGSVDCWTGRRRNLQKRPLGREEQINGRLWTGEIQGENTGKWIYLREFMKGKSFWFGDRVNEMKVGEGGN